MYGGGAHPNKQDGPFPTQCSFVATFMEGGMRFLNNWAGDDVILEWVLRI